MTAHAKLIEGGPEADTVCDACGLRQRHARTEDAQAATREHNRTRHAYTEQQLEIPEQEQA